MATITKTTLLDLVQVVGDFSASDAETVATVAYLVNSGKVLLCGNFAGAKIDLGAPATSVKTHSRRSVARLLQARLSLRERKATRTIRLTSLH
jgi:hypothetical protein